MKHFWIFLLSLLVISEASGNLWAFHIDNNTDYLIAKTNNHSPLFDQSLKMKASIKNNELHFTTTDDRPCLGFQFSFLYDTTIISIVEIEVLGDPDPIHYNETKNGRYIILYLAPTDMPIDLSLQDVIVKVKFSKVVEVINLYSFSLSSCTELEAIFAIGDSFIGTGITSNLQIVNDDCAIAADCQNDAIAPVIECGYSEVIKRKNNAGSYEINAGLFRNRVYDNCAVNNQIKIWLSKQHNSNIDINSKIIYPTGADTNQLVYLFAKDGNENISVCPINLIFGDMNLAAIFDQPDTSLALVKTVDGLDL